MWRALSAPRVERGLSYLPNTEGGGGSFPRPQPSSDTPELVQGLLELLWMVYSEGKLQSCLRTGY